MRPLVLPLGKIREKDKIIVGTKAFRLSQLAKRGLPVPSSFVLTTHGFDLFFEKNNLFYLLERLSVIQDRNILEDLLRELKRKTKNGQFVKILEEEIKKAILKFKGKTLAVRSSATSEDLAFASFAGQFESYLNVPEGKVFNFVKVCWASLFEERVLSYTLYHQIPMHKIKMAVLVQEMIKAERGGVIFTEDILRNNERVLVIEATKGLGTGVVEGTKIPDRFIVEKADLKTIGQKLVGQRPILSHEEIFALASLGLLIENFYKTPQDIEWIIKDSQVFILQARPITT